MNMIYIYNLNNKENKMICNERQNLKEKNCINAECYTTEYRQCLSPKGQIYLKADSEGKPDLTFNQHFRRISLCHIYIYIHPTHVYL